MIYYIPAFFIVLDFISLLLFSYLSKCYNTEILVDKYDDKELNSYFGRNSFAQVELNLAFTILLFCEFVYFVICLFYPFWVISVIVIAVGAIYGILTINIKNPIEKVIKKAKLKNFHSSDLKFDRLLKLNELNDVKIYKISPVHILISLKIIIFASIIIYYCNINPEIDRIGYYSDKVDLTDSKDTLKSVTERYKVRVFIKEVEKYSNGLLKIELTKVEVLEGWNPNQYDWVKTCIKYKFSSLKKESDITWLEIKK